MARGCYFGCTAFLTETITVAGDELGSDKSLRAQLLRAYRAGANNRPSAPPRPSDIGPDSPGGTNTGGPLSRRWGRVPTGAAADATSRGRAADDPADVREAVDAFRAFAERWQHRGRPRPGTGLQEGLHKPRLTSDEINRLRRQGRIDAAEELLYIAAAYMVAPTAAQFDALQKVSAQVRVLCRTCIALVLDEDCTALRTAHALADPSRSGDGYGSALGRLSDETKRHIEHLCRESGATDANVAQFLWGNLERVRIVLNDSTAGEIRAAGESGPAIESLKRDIARINGAVFWLPSNIVRPTPCPLTEDDSRLVSRWGCGLGDAGQGGGPQDLARRLSARIAENQARAFYRARGASVEDTSLAQLNAPDDPRWRTHDLEADGVPLDVKNSRRERGRKGYTHYYVPKFKEAAADAERSDVRIVGIASYVRSLEELRANNGTDGPLVLGETSRHDIERCAAAFPDIMEGSFQDVGDAGYHLPPWVFSYPPVVYAKRDRALAEFRALDVTPLTRGARRALGVVPLALAAGRYDDACLAGLTPAQAEFVRAWQRARESCGSGLMPLYLTVLSYVLRRIVTPDGSGFNANELRLLLLPNGSNQPVNCPLGIWDPLLTIDTLIGTLVSLRDAAAADLATMRAWRLRRLQLLQGRDGRGVWRTVIAYCHHCALAPLVLGHAEQCSCGCLVCPACGYGRAGCPNRFARTRATS